MAIADAQFLAALLRNSVRCLGKLIIFNEAAAVEAIVEPDIDHVLVRKKKQKGQHKEDPSRLPVRIENDEMTKPQLLEIYGEGSWTRLTDKVFSRV